MSHQVLRVDPQVLRAHAGVVGRLADEVGWARAAGVHVVMGREAFGRLCQFLPDMLEQATAAAVDTLAAAETVARETAVRLRQVAAGYERADHASRIGLDGAWHARERPW